MSTRCIKVLLIEDNPGDARLIKELFSECVPGSFELQCVESLAQGFAILGSEEIDTILLDLSLPDSQGFETFTRVHNRTPGIPIIILTGFDDETLAIKAVQQGAQDYLSKGHVSRHLLTSATRYAIERKRAELALRISEERFRMAQEAARCATWEWDLVTNENIWSDNLWKLYGLEPMGGPVSWKTWRQGVHPDDRKRVEKEVWKARSRCEEINVEWRLLGGEPPIRWLMSRGMPITNSTGQVSRYLGIVLDITDRKQSEISRENEIRLQLEQKQLLAANDELERRVEQRTLELQETQKKYLHAEKLAAIGRLSASFAHEFNNPLQGIMAILNGLKKRAILEQEDRELLDAAICESQRVKDLIRSLQDFNRPTSGRKGVMDIHQALDSLLLLHKSYFKDKGISVVLDYAEQLPQVVAVADQIKQVFLNLLTNAADACQQPGDVITVSTRQEEDKVAVAIADTGIGIQPEKMEMIFQPFYTTKPEVKGTGLGLSVSYGIVNNHNGEIRVDSRPGEGATFTVVLPVLDEVAGHRHRPGPLQYNH